MTKEQADDQVQDAISSLQKSEDYTATAKPAPLENRPGIRVRVLSPAEAATAASVLAEAFEQEPAKLTMLPNAHRRRLFLKTMMKVRVYDATRYGTVHVAEIDGELGAVALWYPPGVPMLSMAGAGRMVLAMLGLTGSIIRAWPHIMRTMLSDLRGFIALLRQRRPAVRRATQGLTWRLDLLGTLPAQRGKGLARALLERQLRRCDQDGAVAWLEATDPVNPPIYERFGFKTIARIDGPAWLLGYWVMRRDPKT